MENNYYIRGMECDWMNLNKEVRWKDKQYIAFDFFDTTIHRNCHPEVILFEWSTKISIYFSFKISANV